MTQGVVICINHGGGPLSAIGHPSHDAIRNDFEIKVREILRLGSPNQPRAIVMVTAHWSEDQPRISGSVKHALYYDYMGFPREAYKLRYDAPGSPTVAAEIEEAFSSVGLHPRLDKDRGWDHGVFVPLISINPSADIPVVQVSVLTSEDPYQHVLMGRALGALRSSNIAIIGSGSPSFHNSPLIFSGFTSKSDFKKRYARWNQKLDDIIKESSRKLRTEQILKWRDLPNAYEMHPRHGAEHFLPLIVCVGAAGDGECSSHPVEFLGMGTTTYYWD